MRLIYHQIDSWPSLAWMARCTVRDDTVDICHGPGVETREEWFCEAAWDGPFSEGDFDRTDIVVGSGGRCRRDRLIFISAGNCTERLHWLKQDSVFLVSNSLVCIVAVSGAELDPSYPNYFHDLRSIGAGLDKYKDHVKTSKGDIQLGFFCNLTWDGEKLEKHEKPMFSRPFERFDEYREFLFQTAKEVIACASSPDRHSEFSPIGALSSGYDSVAATVIAREFGCSQALTVPKSREGWDDSGVDVATALDMEAVLIEADSWHEFELPEIPFIAANALGEEVYLKGGEPHLNDRLFFTGYFGDQVWGKVNRAASDRLVWGGHGLALSEYRLERGFLHAPVAYWGARQMLDIIAISNAQDMAPWDVPGSYSRPICRRIAEEAGVPRELFGQDKKAVAVLFQCNEFLSSRSRSAYFTWLSKNRREWFRRGRLPPVPSHAVDQAIRYVANLAWLLADRLGMSNLSTILLNPLHVRRYIFVWAIEYWKRRYSEEEISVLSGYGKS